ncbi:MAG: heat-inducible transcriptional repressor HrcA, partial [Flavobacterium sp.]|nr:heat-inducible transcriptional repressor HrcA [Flavobacterium sp.]
MLTERQTEILNRLIQEYIYSAKPVSSQLLEKKHNFGICPAMLRIEMQKLTEQEFLFQPHTSAGRTPTDKGYRFFVDKLFETGFSEF